jgi:hypothetical protein
MARKQTEADKLAASLERQLAALNAQPSPVDVVKNIINPTASTREVNTYEEAVSRFSEIQNPDIRAQLERLAGTVTTRTADVTQKYDALGYDYNPSTGAATQRATTPLQNNAIPASGVIAPTGTTGPTLAKDFFVNTLALLMGSREEANKPYVTELYKLVSGFYKDGATIPDAINLALYQAKEQKSIPEFTNRFSGIFALQDRRLKGEAIDVPTIAEYVKSQQRLGDILRQSALGDLANETFLNTVMATGKSVDESTSIIVDVFDLIDNAPAAVKAEVAKNYPSVTRAQLATALLTGAEGVKQLEKSVKKSGVIAAGTMQGIQVSDTLASDLVSKGQNFQTAGVGFSKVAQILPAARRLTSIDAGLAAGQQEYTTEQAVAATFDQSAKELQILADAAEREGARFSKRTGIAGSRSLASQARGYGSGLI